MSSDSDEENDIRYGTPLEPYEEDEIPTKRKYQQQPDQYAVDAHGRRKFHGAFTGGFSAGFGNTVGSQEGWTPSTFKSSRTEKAQVSSQRPEDFMDEEDRDEYGIAPRHMQTQNEFTGQKRPRQQRFHDGPIPGEPVLEQLVHAVHETAAVRMLRAMGWRPGQGTGDRVSRGERRRARDHHKVYGCYMPPELRQNQETEEDSSDSEFDYETLFAPEDYEPYILCRKSDRFGLGYSGLSRHSVLGNLVGEYDSGVGTSRSHLVMKDKGKKVSIRGQAFGVGAFEADDEDIYAKEDMSHYDYAIGGATDDKQTKKTNKEKSNNVLEGFVKATKPMPSVTSYPPPALPRDYAPVPAGARRSRFEPTDHPQRDQGLGRHDLTAEARGVLLGETQVPKVTEHTETNKPTTPADDPVVKLVGKTIDFVTRNNNDPLDYIPITDSGKELTKVFKPFVSNPKKQARYEHYLKDKNAVPEREGAMDNLSEWEREREMAEFEQAAKLYRPLTGVMGDRFTHASEPDDALNPLLAVAKSSTNYGLASAEQIEAARCGVYGAMTRREAPWRPDPVLCKRFNVPDPGGARIDSKKEDKPKVSYSIFSYLESSVHDKDSFAKEQSKFSGSKSLNRDAITKTVQQNDKKSVIMDQEENNKKSVKVNEDATDGGFAKRMTVAEMFLKESEKNKVQGEEVTETINKFDKMDLYKSIFLSDSEEDDTAVENEINKNKGFEDFIEVPKNVKRNTSPPRGIFANIDFDELNSWRRKVDDKNPADNKEKESNNGSTSKERDGDIIIAKDKELNNDGEAIYGPRIPENLQKRLQSAVIEKDFKPIFKKAQQVQEVGSSDSDSWIDVKEVKSKKQKKKKTKKHKAKSDKKHKSKHKKKR